MKYSANSKRIAPLIIIAGFALLILLLQSSENEVVSSGANRTFSYISAGNLDMSHTSGPDNIYKNVLLYISEKPIMGYGLLNFFDKLHFYPHNIFLEELLQGGFLYFSFFLVVVIRFLVKLRKMVKSS